MQGLMDTYMLYSYSRGIEEFKFFNNFIDYLFYFFIIIPLIIISSILLPTPLLQQALLGSLTYTWSRANKDHQVSIYFISIKASLLPVVTLGFRLLLEGNIAFLAVLTGMASAYVYACIESWTLGPLYTYFCETFGIRIQNVNRVGTLNQIEETTMKAPQWFKTIVEKFINVNNPKQLNKNKIHTLNSTNDNSTSGSISSGSIFGNGQKFQGKGYRLGSD
ncbi:DER1-like family member protein 1 [Wickerhamomyces ciferrii]|uniref:Derlin n=1 Tax=Wickerhamomyces ciferrii (strain ATCC 14091 / BCRC 22168 / CBS 111 / JCM 3599 / NBRC 0793 / NRRL Y-1031 F-60-10) TaxID=1206466 RepID=K0KXM7_WICCF|nr:DER1-like family member protein 1 [Wickerhamomyces ciferrii]CCH45803.1 DER1-like family member protein 1 [Wickerhamomyces ciferrii]